MAYLWGKYERKAEYKNVSELVLLRKNYVTGYTEYDDERNRQTFRITGIEGNPVYIDNDHGYYEREKIREYERNPRYRNVRVVSGYDASFSGGIKYYICYDEYTQSTKRVFSHYSQGSYIGEVESLGRHDYPDNGEKGGYFYVYKGVKEVKAPGSISYSSSAKAGEDLEIRWDYVYSASEYILEKSTGSGFRQVYNGSLNYYSDTLGTDKKVQYRVKAIENGESSSYTTGNWCYVETNQAPTISGRDEDLGDKNAPFKQSFTVNDSDSGNTLKVTVKLNSAIIQTIENANRNETYTINIDKEKFDELTPNKQNTITVTVDDGQGASANRRWVFTKRNTPPTVSVDQSNLGEQNKPFSFSFTPNDVDGDEITGKVFLDEVQIEDLGTLTRGQSKKVTINKLDFAVLKNGDHRIRIEVTDSKGAKGYGHIDFSKNLTYCWYEFKKDIEGMATSIIVNPSVKLASGAKMTVKVCNNAKDREPVWETIPSEQVGKAYSFRNKNKTADTWSIGVNIRIDRSKAKEDSYFYGFVGNYQ